MKCYTYPFGDLDFWIKYLAMIKTEKTIRTLLSKYKIEPLLVSRDSEGHIELKICDVKDFTTPSFINFILELQTLTDLLGEK